MPVLELKDGTKMHESMAIARYLGTLHGYYPDDAMMQFEIDCLLDCYEDVIIKVYKPHFRPVAQHPEMFEDIFGKVLPKFLSVMETVCDKEDKFLVGNNLTVVDFFIGGLYTNYINNKNVSFAPDLWAKSVENYPKFKAYGERFAEAVKGRLDSRGQYPV